MKATVILYLLFIVTGLTSCNNEQSLQEYYISNQGNNEFLALDVPASLLTNTGSLDESQRSTLETIKKINILAIPKKAENQEKIEFEKNKVAKILDDEKYQLLMRLGGGESKVELYFTGDDEAVNEIIVYGFHEERGMGIARVLGDKMNPSAIFALMQSFEKGDLQLDGLSGVTNMFIERTEK